jgi:hypothetical protein
LWIPGKFKKSEKIGGDVSKGGEFNDVLNFPLRCIFRGVYQNTGKNRDEKWP